MALPKLTFTKTWTAPASESGKYLPAIEPSEEQAREDLQVQHDDTAAWALLLVNALNYATNLGENDDYSGIGENITNVKAALISLKSQITAAAEGQINPHTLTTEKMSRLSVEGTAAIGTDNIENGAVTTAKLSTLSGAEAVSTATIQDGAVTNAKLASGTGENAAVAGSNIQTGAIGTSHLSTGAVTHDKLAADAVDTDNIVDDAVTDDKLAASGLDISRFTTGTLDNGRLSNVPASALAGSIPNSKLDTTCVKSVNGNTNAVVTHLFKTGTCTAFTTGGSLTDYPYRASITDSDVTANDKVYVEFDATQINAGIFGPITESYAGGFYIFAEEAHAAENITYTIFKKGTQ